MASGLGELVIELGTIGDTKQLEAFVKKVKEAASAIEDYGKKQDSNSNGFSKAVASAKSYIKSIRGVALAITGALYAINRLTNDLVQNNQAFVNLTRQSDIALTTFQKWDSIGKMFGIEGAANQLENLNQRLFELRLTGEGARGFQLAGINPIGQSAEGVLEQLRTRIRGMDNTTAGYLLKQMGLDPRMITLLRMSRAEFEELGATIKKYQLTEVQRQQIEKMNIQLQIAGQKLKYLKDRAVIAIMPYWVKFIQSLARVTEGLMRVVNWTMKAVKYIGSLQIGAVKLSQIITTVLIPALLALGLIFKPLETLFIGLYLIIDDFVGFLQGKDSVIGLLFNFLDELNDKINFDTPKWIQDLLAALQNIDNLQNFTKVAQNVATGKQNEVDVKKIPQSILENPATWLMFPQLAPLGWGSKAWSNMLPTINRGIEADNIESGLITPDMTQSIDNSNTTSNNTNNVNLTAYVTTNQPAQEMMNEYRHLQAAYGIG